MTDRRQWPPTGHVDGSLSAFRGAACCTGGVATGCGGEGRGTAGADVFESESTGGWVWTTGGRRGSAGDDGASCGFGVVGAEGAAGRLSDCAGVDVLVGAGLDGVATGAAGVGAVGATGGAAGFGACDICSGNCALVGWLSGLRSGAATFGVTITDGGLKFDGIGSGRLGMNTGVESFSMAGFGGETGAGELGVMADGVADSRGGIAGTSGSTTCGGAAGVGVALGVEGVLGAACATFGVADAATGEGVAMAGRSVTDGGGTTTRGVATGVGASEEIGRVSARR